MKIALIAAIAKNGVIGKNNTLPWHLPADLANFKKITTGHCIVMGRKCYESIGKKLPNRTNIVLSSQQNLQLDPEIILLHDPIESINWAKKNQEKILFIIGGASIYEQFLPLTDIIYLTQIHAEIDGDIFFPNVNWKEWKIKQKTDFLADEKNKIPYSFLIYEKKMN